MTNGAKSELKIRAINHLALVCKDMGRTVEFYRDVLGMPLIKTLALKGQEPGYHFFLDMGNGGSLAFFWFENAAAAQPGVSAPRDLPGVGSIASAHGSMNHVAFDVAPEQFDAWVARLAEKGVKTTKVLNHDDSPRQISDTVNENTFVRSVYFRDPDGVLLEIASWMRPIRAEEVVQEHLTPFGLTK
jgi:catechol 2,3-dioxygenase-like lactoylglutathione lyase family enzyme